MTALRCQVCGQLSQSPVLVMGHDGRWAGSCCATGIDGLVIDAAVTEDTPPLAVEAPALTVAHFVDVLSPTPSRRPGPGR